MQIFHLLALHQALDRPRAKLIQTLDTAEDAIKRVESELDGVLEEYSTSLYDIRDDTMPEMRSARGDMVTLGRKQWDAAYQVKRECYAKSGRMLRDLLHRLGSNLVFFAYTRVPCSRFQRHI